MVHTFNYVGLGYNNIYILNELLGPAAGFFPDSNSLPAYVHLYGFLLKPFANVLNVTTLTSAAIMMMTVCSISAAIIGVLIAHRALGRRSLTIAAALVIPLMSVTVLHDPVTNLAVWFQDFPVRIFPGVLIAAIGLDQIVRVRGGQHRQFVLVMLGVLCGLVAWNNQDFDLASVAAFGIVFWGATWGMAARWKPRAAVLAGLFIGLAIYPVWATASGHALLWSDLIYFQTKYSGGFASFPVVIVGPVLVVMAVIIATTATGWFMFVARPNGPRPQHGRSDYALLVTLYFGTWSTIAFPYYLNRSISTQLEIYLLPCAVTIAGLIGVLLENDISFPVGGRALRRHSLTRPLLAAPLTLAGSWCLASALQSANTVTAISWIVNSPRGQNFVWYDTSVLTAARQQATAQHQTIGFYGAFASWEALVAKLEPLALTDQPGFYSPTSPDSVDCQYLKRHATDEVIVDYSTFQTYGNNVCGIYRRTTTALGPPDNPEYVIYRHIGPPRGGRTGEAGRLVRRGGRRIRLSFREGEDPPGTRLRAHRIPRERPIPEAEYVGSRQRNTLGPWNQGREVQEDEANNPVTWR